MAGLTDFDAIVIGVGSMGAATCYQLARRGYRVLGLEQYQIVHDRGSHAGQSRIYRMAYFEHPDYVPLLRKAYENWRELERVSGQQLMYETGLLYMGPAGHALLQGVQLAADTHGLHIEHLDVVDLGRRFPVFRCPNSYDAIFEPAAGLIPPEKAIRTFVNMARSYGADIRPGQALLGWEEREGKIQVRTESGQFSASKLICTAGSWTGKYLPELAQKLRVTRQPMLWVQPADTGPVSLGRFPCWLLTEPNRPGAYYGFPLLPEQEFEGPAGLKIAYHYPGDTADPDTIRELVQPQEEADLLRVMNDFLPDVYQNSLSRNTCLYTNTPDEHFIIDQLPGSGNIVFAAGFSGHGFKFASAIGELLADLAFEGGTETPIEFLSLQRFDNG